MSKWRRLRRGLVIALAGGLVLYLALLVYGRVRLRRAEAAFLKTFGTLDLASFERPDPPRAQNAAAWFSAGAAAIVVDDRTSTWIQALDARPLRDWSGSDRERLRALLTASRCALDLLQRAEGAPDMSWGIRYSRGVQAEIPNLRALRLARTVLASEAHFAVERGDIAASTRALRSLSRLSTSLENESTLITLTAGVDCERMLLRALADLLVSSGPAHDEVSRLADMREVLPSNDLVAAARRAFATDSLAVSQAMGRGPEAGVWYPGGWRLRWMMMWFSELLRAEVLDQAVAQASLVARPTSIPPSSDEAIRRPGRHGPAAQVVAVFVPSGNHARLSIDTALASRHLIRAALALRSIGVVGGAYPDALPAELRSPDTLTGRPLAYTLNPDGSANLALQLDAAARTPLLLRAIALPPPTRPAARR